MLKQTKNQEKKSITIRYIYIYIHTIELLYFIITCNISNNYDSII